MQRGTNVLRQKLYVTRMLDYLNIHGLLVNKENIFTYS